MKTKALMDKAIGKVLFIDDAYGLNPQHGGQGGGATFMQEVCVTVVYAISSFVQLTRLEISRDSWLRKTVGLHLYLSPDSLASNVA